LTRTLVLNGAVVDDHSPKTVTAPAATQSDFRAGPGIRRGDQSRTIENQRIEEVGLTNPIRTSHRLKDFLAERLSEPRGSRQPTARTGNAAWSRR